MTNNKKCKCDKSHTLLDIYNTDEFHVKLKQKWHSCYKCGKFQVSKWIRLHEFRCETATVKI